MRTKFISVNGKNISAQLLGEGERLIVLLHGAGVISPILEFQALAGLLAAKYQVLIIENPGYGFSDCTSEERTIERIAYELHEVISAFGHKQYILMGHSISGVYSLYYSNQYPHEVLAFIGIDSSVPRQIDVINIQKINLFALKLTRFFLKSGLLRLVASRPSSLLPSIEGVRWSDDEIRLYRQLYLNKSSNDTVFNELQNLNRNFRKARPMHFPDTMPTLFFLSERTCKQLKNWEQMHRELAGLQSKSKIIRYDGTHFLHYSHPSQIAEESIKWLVTEAR